MRFRASIFLCVNGSPLQPNTSGFFELRFFFSPSFLRLLFFVLSTQKHALTGRFRVSERRAKRMSGKYRGKNTASSSFQTFESDMSHGSTPRSGCVPRRASRWRTGTGVLRTRQSKAEKKKNLWVLPPVPSMLRPLADRKFLSLFFGSQEEQSVAPSSTTKEHEL